MRCARWSLKRLREGIKRSGCWNFHRERRESFIVCFSCSYRSRCSRFIEFKRSVRCNPNRESFYGLFFLVRTLRVVRGSRNSKGVSVVDSNRERRENREQKRSVPCSSKAVPAREGRKIYGVSAGICSYPSRCTRFKEFKGRVH